MNVKYDVLFVILSKYKDAIDLNCKNSKGMTSLHILCLQDSLTMEGQRILINSPYLKINEKEKINGYTPLHLAVVKGNIEVVKFLFQIPFLNLHALDNDDNTPFHLIFKSKKCYHMLKLFLLHSSSEFDLMKRNKKVFI